jgi:hypothetical protein
MMLIALGWSLQTCYVFLQLTADLGLKDSTASTTDDRILETLEFT